MLIGWFTVIAQIVNFVVLVLLLKRFLYGPIIRAVDERQASIARQLDAAEQKRKEASLEAETYRQKNRELELGRDDLLREARAEVETWRKEMMHKAHREVEEAKAHWYRALEQEQEAFLRDLHQHTCHQACVIARQALTEIADTGLERHVIRVFVERLSTLPRDELAAMTDHQEPGQELVVTSAFELPEEARRQVQAAVQEHLDYDSGLRFETSPDLICGIELRTHGHRLAWSLADYLDALEVRTLIAQPGLEASVEAWNDRG